MTISSLGPAQQNYISLLTPAQGVQPAQPLALDSTGDTQGAGTSTSTNLTGSPTAGLNSITLSALLNLTQQDPSQQTGQAAPATGTGDSIAAALESALLAA